MKHTLLIILFFSSAAKCELLLPDWITHQKLSDNQYHYVICSNQNENPEVAKKRAEIECLVNIMKLSGAKTVFTEKFESSLNENVYESNMSSEGVEGNVRCEFTDMYTENIQNAFRIWLKCRIGKQELIKYSKENINGEIAYGPKPLFDQIRKLEDENKKLKEKDNKIIFLENGKMVKTSANKLISKFVFTGMTVSRLREKISTKYLIFNSSDKVCRSKFDTDEVYFVDDSRICVSGINGIVLGFCDSNNNCSNN